VWAAAAHRRTRSRPRGACAPGAAGRDQRRRRAVLVHPPRPRPAPPPAPPGARARGAYRRRQRTRRRRAGPGWARRGRAVMNVRSTLVPARLKLGDQARVASVGLRSRPLRAALSGLGIAIGPAAIVAGLGLSASSQAGLLAEIDRLGTNLLTVTNGQSFTGQPAQLPLAAPARISRINAVEQVAHAATVGGANVYRSPLIPAIQTNALQ